MSYKGYNMYLMSIKELAEYLGETRRTIYRYIQSGDCPPFIRITKKNIKFDKKDVDAWLESKKIRPQQTVNQGDSDA
jgi:excisionase family DNA binding protein